MAEPVTIGDQTFIKTTDGWIDKKTKTQAPEDLFSLLNMLSVESSGDYKRLRVRVDRTKPPITITNQEYIFDLNQGKWLNKKTKDPVNDALQKIINGVLAKIEAEKGAIASSIVRSIGISDQKENSIKANLIDAAPIPNMKGIDAEAVELENKKSNASSTAAARSAGKTTSGTGKLPKINSPIIKMIEKLATIDGHLKQRLDNQKKIAAQNLAMTRENAVEATPTDASPVQEIEKEDATKSNAGNIAAALLIGGLIASQFEPVREAFKTMIDGVKGVFNFVNDVAKSIADGLDFFTGSSSSTSSDTASTPTSTPTASNVNNASPSDPNVVETPSAPMPSESNKAEASNVSSPSQNNAIAPSQASTKNQSSKANSPTVGTSSVASSSASSVASSSSTKSTGRSSTAVPSSSTSPATSNAASPATSNAASPATSNATSPTTSNAASPVQPSAQAAAPSKDATQQKSAQTADASKIDGTNYNGLTMKNREENTGGGPAAENTIKFAKIVQPGLGNMFGRFTAFNDKYHQGITEYVSPHTKGIAFDLTVKDPSQAAAASNKIKALADENKFKVSVLNEYANPTAKSTGGHIHVTVNGPGIGSSVRGGTGMGEPGGDGSALGDVAGSLYDLGAGALKAIGSIIGAGLGKQVGRSVTESLSQYAPNTAGEIAAASVKRSGDIAAAKTPDVDTSVSIKDPMDLNKNKPTEVVQNVPTSADYAGVDFYLTRMGFPKIEYHAPAKQERMA